MSGRQITILILGPGNGFNVQTCDERQPKPTYKQCRKMKCPIEEITDSVRINKFLIEHNNAIYIYI